MDLKERCRKITLLLLDVDGVLTDGRLLLVPMPDGSVVEAKAFKPFYMHSVGHWLG